MKSLTNKGLTAGKINKDIKTTSEPQPSSNPTSEFLRGVANTITSIDAKVIEPDRTTTRNFPS
jgi:hypothetical protein